jgi:hypothetical protein
VKQTTWSTLMILIITLLIGIVSPVYAAETVTDLFRLDTITSVVVNIEWEEGDIDFSIISPSGTIITRDTRNPNIAFVALDSAIMILIMNAEVGQWSLRYDKRSNASISVSVDEYEEGVWITQLELGTQEGSILPVTFRVEHDQNVSYRYELSLALAEGGMEKVVYNGNGTANEDVNMNIDLYSYSSHDQYLLKLNVIYTLNGYDYIDFAYAPFSFINERSPSVLERFDIIIDEAESTMTLDWSKYVPYYYEGVLVAIFDNDNTEPTVLHEAAPNDPQSLSTYYNSEADKITMDIKVKAGALYSESIRKVIYPKQNMSGFYITADEVPVTNISRYAFQHYNAVDQVLDITVNEQQSRILLDGDGEKGIHLKDDSNNIIMQYTDLNDVTWIKNRYVYVDQIPPVLQLFEDVDGLQTTASSFIITGQTEGGAVLMMNDTAIELQENGGFSFKMNLADGNNEVLIRSTDAANNSSLMEVTIRKDKSTAFISNEEGNPNSWIHYLPLLITLFITLVLSILIFIYWKKKTE